jgi:hypothetical protein
LGTFFFEVLKFTSLIDKAPISPGRNKFLPGQPKKVKKVAEIGHNGQIWHPPRKNTQLKSRFGDIGDFEISKISTQKPPIWPICPQKF